MGIGVYGLEFRVKGSGQGDLVSRLKMGIIGFILIWLIVVTSLLAKTPRPPKQTISRQPASERLKSSQSTEPKTLPHPRILCACFLRSSFVWGRQARQNPQIRSRSTILPWSRRPPPRARMWLRLDFWWFSGFRDLGFNSRSYHNR